MCRFDSEFAAQHVHCALWPTRASTRGRAGKINTLWVLLLGAAAAMVLLVSMLWVGADTTADDTNTLTMFCAAGMMVPVEEIAQQYEEEYDVRVELQFGGSNDLLNKLQINQHGGADLYLAADDFYTGKAVSEGLAVETIPIAHQGPVIVVQQKNAKQIEKLSDLLRDDVSVAIADPEVAAVGRAIQSRLEKVTSADSNLWKQLAARVTAGGVFKPTVNEVATAVKVGSVDAGIVWDSTAAMPKYRDDLKAIGAVELSGDPNLISIAVLKQSEQPTAALKFARFLSSRDRGLEVFQKYGTKPVEGDVWAETPQINFFCGAMNRRAVAKIVEDFQTREGVVVNTTYNGCGTLTGQMKTFAGQRTDLGFPDVYMACDVYYLEPVREWFQEAQNVSDAEIVIAVPKGSEKVRTIDDLIEPGVTVAIGEPEMCTIGVLTKKILQREGLYEDLKKKQAASGETVVEKVSSALLVPDVAAGSVDATIAYITDVKANSDKVDWIHIDSPLNTAVQPFSISKSSQHKYLMRRLFHQVASNPAAFEDVGFNFRLESQSPTSTEAAIPQ